MKDLDTLSVSKVGQSTLPKWWREASGLAQGGVVEVRPLRDGKNSIVLTPRPAKRRGSIGLLKLFSKCPAPILPPERHHLPFKLDPLAQ
jgi:hypothetical protein